MSWKFSFSRDIRRAALVFIAGNREFLWAGMYYFVPVLAVRTCQAEIMPRSYEAYGNAYGPWLTKLSFIRDTASRQRLDGKRRTIRSSGTDTLSGSRPGLEEFSNIW